MRPFIAVDLDGTLADTRAVAQKYFPKGGPIDYAGFYHHIGEAKINPLMRDVLRGLVSYARYPNLDWEVWTARQEARGREPTEAWLRKHHLKPSAVRMNPDGDVYIPAVSIKAQFVADFGKPIMAFDDDETVIQMYTELDIPTFKVHIL